MIRLLFSTVRSRAPTSCSGEVPQHDLINKTSKKIACASRLIAQLHQHFVLMERDLQKFIEFFNRANRREMCQINFLFLKYYTDHHSRVTFQKAFYSSKSFSFRFVIHFTTCSRWEKKLIYLQQFYSY